MAYNREIKNFAPLPYGPWPTHAEIAAIVRRGRRLQSRIFWNKLTRKLRFGELRTATKHTDVVVQAPLMWSMLELLGFDVSRLKQDEFKSKIATMTDRCVSCANAATCRSWLKNLAEIDAYREFCPNASEFDTLPRIATSH